jgi:hypothetical protein
MPSGRTWKYLSIGFIGGIVGSVGLAVASVAILASLSSKPSASGVVLSDIGCPSGMVENLATSRCEATDQTISAINNSFRKHSGSQSSTPLPTAKRIGELASKIVDNKGRFSVYRIAALLGDAESQYEVGGMLSKGVGTKEDDLEALRWLHEAAHNNHLEAQVRLAQMLSSGTYVKRNQRLARVWLERAEANKNHKTKHIAELKV